MTETKPNYEAAQAPGERVMSEKGIFALYKCERCRIDATFPRTYMTLCAHFHWCSTCQCSTKRKCIKEHVTLLGGTSDDA